MESGVIVMRPSPGFVDAVVLRASATAGGTEPVEPVEPVSTPEREPLPVVAERLGRRAARKVAAYRDMPMEVTPGTEKLWDQVLKDAKTLRTALVLTGLYESGEYMSDVIDCICEERLERRDEWADYEADRMLEEEVRKGKKAEGVKAEEVKAEEEQREIDDQVAWGRSVFQGLTAEDLDELDRVYEERRKERERQQLSLRMGRGLERVPTTGLLMSTKEAEEPEEEVAAEEVVVAEEGEWPEGAG